jgi:hypothetical protein
MPAPALANQASYVSFQLQVGLVFCWYTDKRS